MAAETICADCGLDYNGEHPTWFPHTEDRRHARCEYCWRIPGFAEAVDRLDLSEHPAYEWNGLMSPSDKGVNFHQTTKRHRAALRVSGMGMAAMLERSSIVLPHYAGLAKARAEGETVHFDIAADA